jgi:hypothetical protein
MSLPDVTPRSAPAEVSIEDVRAMIKGLRHGWYKTRDLYPRYLAWAKQAGKRPANRVRLGQALLQVADSSYVAGHIRVFELNDPGVLPSLPSVR